MFVSGDMCSSWGEIKVNDGRKWRKGRRGIAETYTGHYKGKAVKRGRKMSR